jgi:hypothetical protein
METPTNNPTTAEAPAAGVTILLPEPAELVELRAKCAELERDRSDKGAKLADAEMALARLRYELDQVHQVRDLVQLAPCLVGLVELAPRVEVHALSAVGSRYPVAQRALAILRSIAAAAAEE